LFQLDADELKKELVLTKIVLQKGQSTEIPKCKRGFRKILGLGSSNFEPELQAKYPDIKRYAGVGITDPNASINFSLSPKVFKL
jgi:hypothetical protein